VTIITLRILFYLSIVFKKKKIPRAMEGAVLQKRWFGSFKVKRIAHNVPAVCDVFLRPIRKNAKHFYGRKKMWWRKNP
jgi:hypothetical protein